MSEKKVAVVTGGGTGIGAACVRELAAKGFRVGIHYRSSGEAPRRCWRRSATDFSSRRIWPISTRWRRWWSSSSRRRTGSTSW